MSSDYTLTPVDPLTSFSPTATRRVGGPVADETRELWEGHALAQGHWFTGSVCGGVRTKSQAQALQGPSGGARPALSACAGTVSPRLPTGRGWHWAVGRRPLGLQPRGRCQPSASLTEAVRGARLPAAAGRLLVPALLWAATCGDARARRRAENTRSLWGTAVAPRLGAACTLFSR